MSLTFCLFIYLLLEFHQPMTTFLLFHWEHDPWKQHLRGQIGYKLLGQLGSPLLMTLGNYIFSTSTIEAF